MSVNITCRHIEIDAPTRERIELKASKLTRFHDKIQSVDVIVSQEKHAQVAEVIALVDGAAVKSRKTGEDLIASLDAAFDKVQRQLKRYKTRLIDTHRRSTRRLPAQETIFLMPEETDEDQAPPLIDRTGRAHNIEMESREILSLTPEEAAMHLDLSDQFFFIFLNVDNHHINVIYNRPDGRCGLIEPLIEAPAESHG